MREPEHIKEIHRIREKLSRESNFSVAKFAEKIRQAEKKEPKTSSPQKVSR